MDTILNYVSPLHMWKILVVAFFGTSLFWVIVLLTCVSGGDYADYTDDSQKNSQDSLEEYTSVEDRLRALEDKVRDQNMKDKERPRYIR